ncbi:acetyl-CoA carboxylase biotin carboxylase subunit family protein [Motiliproteus sp. MSK22-1]|uniref:ATP-grasp domain-containing protein n=1 Tax=Motiliproteus sp. MSK22-1 TaxID=1897630 RepID=UPI000977D293|nr:hypothetical protein [Motiliproteus sp. MSK22-1]OMH26644.1 hypothetical protein BGP75_23400 [Motiliproteus sp. MSK22-1]
MESNKPTVGFLSPQPYMEKAISMMKERYNVHVLTPQGWEKEDVDSIVAECHEQDIQAVAGFAQKDAFHHILINEQLGNRAQSRLAFLYCMNKYLMRTLEEDPFWFEAIDPLHETDEQIISKIAEWPFMLKNTSLSLGRGIFKISTPENLREVLKNYREDTALQELIAFQNEHFSRDINPEDMPPVLPPFIAEHLVDMNQAIEYCYEGYVTAEGEVVHYALTEEVYFSNHQALGYLTPPLSINARQAAAIGAWAKDYMGRLADLGYRNQFFNLEFWIMPGGKIALTEINPRAAHSYHYNYLYSFGTSLFEDNLELVQSGKRLPDSPWQKWVAGEDFKYTLIVLITGKHADRVCNILDYNYVDQLEQDQGILIRHNRQREDQLTREDMTAAGVMLLQLWITGDTVSELIRKEREIRTKIYKQVPDDCEYPGHWVAE